MVSYPTLGWNEVVNSGRILKHNWCCHKYFLSCHRVVAFPQLVHFLSPFLPCIFVFPHFLWWVAMFIKTLVCNWRKSRQGSRMWFANRYSEHNNSGQDLIIKFLDAAICAISCGGNKVPSLSLTYPHFKHFLW